MSANMFRPPAPVQSAALECRIAGFGIADLGDEEWTAIRKSPEAHVAMPLAPSVARHCDEQTLASLFAVGQAMRKMAQAHTDFAEWGIVCASRFLGRSFFSQSLAKFDREGPWSTSIQVVPHRSLHSPSSTLSLALGSHGPNIGVGGGRDGEGQALLAATSLLDSSRLPGVWLVLTGWTPEINIDADGRPLEEARCHAIALALQASRASEDGWLLRVVPDLEAFENEATALTNRNETSWLSLLTTMLGRQPVNFNVIAPVCDGLRAELVHSVAAAANTQSPLTELRAAG